MMRGDRLDAIMRFADLTSSKEYGMSIFPAKILLATDGSRESELATRTAVNLSQKTDSELHVIHVFDVAPIGLLYPEATDPQGLEQQDPILLEDRERRSGQRGREVLDAEVERVRSAGGTVAQSHLMMGDVAREIVHLAEDLGAGLIVMGSRGHGGIRRTLMGSVSDAVVRHAHCSVMVVRRKPVVFPSKILLATDGSEDANLAAKTAAELAQTTGSELHVVHVGQLMLGYHPEIPAYHIQYERDKKEAGQLLQAQVERMGATGAPVAQAHLRMGRVDKSIVDLAEELEADLVATGSRGLGGMRRALMGSVSDAVVRHAHCPVVVVRH